MNHLIDLKYCGVVRIKLELAKSITKNKFLRKKKNKRITKNIYK